MRQWGSGGALFCTAAWIGFYLFMVVMVAVGGGLGGVTKSTPQHGNSMITT